MCCSRCLSIHKLSISRPFGYCGCVFDTGGRAADSGRMDTITTITVSPSQADVARFALRHIIDTWDEATCWDSDAQRAETVELFAAVGGDPADVQP